MREITATILGLIQGILVMADKRCNWIFYSLQMLFLVAFSANMHLWGDVTIDSIYFFVGIAGYILWGKGEAMFSVSKYGWKTGIVWIIVSILAVIVAYAVLRNTDNPLPFLDSVTSVTGIVATWFMFRHKLEAWIVWFLNDVAYIAEYISLPDKAFGLISLYILWTVLAVFSYINWKRILLCQTCSHVSNVAGDKEYKLPQ